MVIRQEQLSVFQKQAESAFERKLMKYLREHASAQLSGLSDSDLAGKITLWRLSAVAYDIMTERGIAKWCYLCAIAGKRLTEDPVLAAFLQQPTPLGDEKVNLLLNALELRLRASEAAGD